MQIVVLDSVLACDSQARTESRTGNREKSEMQEGANFLGIGALVAIFVDATDKG